MTWSDKRIAQRLRNDGVTQVDAADEPTVRAAVLGREKTMADGRMSGLDELRRRVRFHWVAETSPQS